MLDAQMYSRTYIKGDGDGYSASKAQKERKRKMDDGQIVTCGFMIGKTEKRQCTLPVQEGVGATRCHVHFNK
jgi:hypothetical protein